MFSADLRNGYVKKSVFLCEACSLNTAEQNTDFPVKKGKCTKELAFKKKKTVIRRRGEEHLGTYLGVW